MVKHESVNSTFMLEFFSIKIFQWFFYIYFNAFITNEDPLFKITFKTGTCNYFTKHRASVLVAFHEFICYIYK